jgi:hypothetical protein
MKLLNDLHIWLIRLVVGKRPVVMNCDFLGSIPMTRSNTHVKGMLFSGNMMYPQG